MDPRKLHNLNTSFFRFPDEVREKIYQFAGGNTIFTVDVEYLPQHVITHSRWDLAARLHPAFPHRLSQVCSLSRSQTMFPEATRRFEFMGHADSLDEFLESLTYRQLEQIFNLKIIVNTKDWSLLDDLNHRNIFPGIGLDHETLLIDRAKLVPLLFPRERLFGDFGLLDLCDSLKRIEFEWDNVKDDGLFTKSDVATAITEWISRFKALMPHVEMVNPDLVEVCEDLASEDMSFGSEDMTLGSEDMDLGSEDTDLGSEDMSLGSEDMDLSD